MVGYLVAQVEGDGLVLSVLFDVNDVFILRGGVGDRLFDLFLLLRFGDHPEWSAGTGALGLTDDIGERVFVSGPAAAAHIGHSDMIVLIDADQHHKMSSSGKIARPHESNDRIAFPEGFFDGGIIGADALTFQTVCFRHGRD